ncbi:Oligosaccaryltransferase-domain-containing protein [Tirmania nivea]|nr:Oligosaccaryltransferase-domain-containing protein [Tirmania nivea]
MITDQQLNSLAIFLGTLMMGLIVLYHFLSVNSQDTESTSTEGGAEKASKHKLAIVGAK